MDKKTFTSEEVEKIKEESKRVAFNEQMQIFAKKIEATMSNNELTRQKKNIFSTNFDKNRVSQWLSNPQKYEKEIRNLSTILSTMIPQYQQIIGYLPAISKYIPVLSPNIDKFASVKGVVEKDKLKKEYVKAVSLLNTMNIQHEFQKITEIICREDIFYGYIYENADTFYIQQLNSDYCRVSTIEDGCFNMKFDLSYFDAMGNLEGTQTKVLDTFPKEFQTKYNSWKKSGNASERWQELESENTIVIKLNENLPFVFPKYSTLFDDIYDLEDYKGIAKTKAETENYKFIGMHLPLLNKSEKPDDFAVDPTTALTFYNMILDNLPKGVGAFISATPYEAVDFKSANNGNRSDEVNNSINTVFMGSGHCGVNFGVGANNAGTIKMSNQVDNAILFKLYRQFERWLNRRFKNKFGGKFSISLLDATVFNIDELIDKYLKLAQFGIPVKLHLCALSGISQLSERGLIELEELLDIANRWKPLSSTHTQGSESGGRPTKKAEDLSVSGQQSRDDSVTENR